MIVNMHDSEPTPDRKWAKNRSGTAVTYQCFPFGGRAGSFAPA
jgi:hypothetical protein